MSTRNQITTRPVELSSLLDGVSNGTVVLPDFQRDFDWNSNEVISLVATLLRGWPAGSLLLMRGEPEFFNTREFEFAPGKASSIDYVVLDGQQRLTSSYLALRNRGPRVYALSFDDRFLEPTPPSAEELEEHLRAVPRDEWEAEWSPLRQARERVVPLYSLLSAPDFFEWRDRVASAAGESSAERIGADLSRLYRQLLGTVNHYDFPAVILESNFPSEAVARIFERINRQGKRLNTFDLMVARSYTKGWNLRDKWSEAVRVSEALETFQKDDGLPVLQLLALHDREDVRQPSVLSLRPARVQEGWQDAVDALEQALRRVREFGASDPEYLPYRAQLLTLGGLEWGGAHSVSTDELETWFWRSSFGARYDVGSSTQVVTDLRNLQQRPGHESTWDSPVRLAEADLVEATRQRTPAVWRAFHALLSRVGARDPVSGEALDVDKPNSVVASLLDRGDGSLHLRLFGQLRVSRDTARRSKSTPLVALIAEANQGPEVLGTQLLPDVSLLSDLASDPESLLKWRIAETERRLTALVGRPVIAVLAAEQSG